MEDIIEKLKQKEIKINDLWNNKENIYKDECLLKIIEEVILLLSNGYIRIAEKIDNNWIVNQWLKKAILLFFMMRKNNIIEGSSYLSKKTYWYDKINSKFEGWQSDDFIKADIRSVPGSIVRESAFIGKKVILMPSFVNVGAYIDDGCMIDSWSTIGSCAQIGKNCHISGGVGIGGVLEPLQANPVIIEDNCFIGARSEVAEGVIIGEGSVLSMGVYLGASTKIIDKISGEIIYGYIPPYSVVIPGSFNIGNNVSTYCAVIIKKVDEKTRSKTSINELLRL